MDKPLVSFIIATYKHEAFIAEALTGAFLQTYSPTEIVVSDDCSPDRTFEIVQHLAGNYRGPHSIRLNRNSRNLGIGGNINRALDLCRGTLLVLAAGDDISLPQRTSTVVDAWHDSGSKATSLSSLFVVVDENNRPAGQQWGARAGEGRKRFVHERGTLAGFLRRRTPHVAGCAHAVAHELFSLFGPMPEELTYEDTALCFRTILANGLFTFINEPLVKYRRHSQTVSFDLHRARPKSAGEFADFQEKRRRELDRFIEVYRCFAIDAERANQRGVISGASYRQIRMRILQESRRFELRRNLLDQPWRRRCAAFCRLYCGSIRPRELLTQLPWLLPRRLHSVAATTWNRIQSKCLDKTGEGSLGGGEPERTYRDYR